MESLNLTQESRRSDGRLKSLLWPTVDNAWDVNYLGQQGFWICLAVAAMTLVLSLLSAQPVAIVVGLLTAVFFFLGGIGVRESSWPAAAMVTVVYALNLLTSLAMGRMPGIISIVFCAVLLSNLRAAFLASEWKPAGPDEDRPERFNETFGDKLVDQLPARLWPALQVPFYILGSLVLLACMAGLAGVLAQRFGLLPHGLAPK